MMKRITPLTAGIALACICSCSHAEGPAPASQIVPKAGHITGTAKTVTGKPLKAFTVQYSGFEEGKLASSFADASLAETIDGSVEGRDGRFSIEVPPGAYRASAFVTYQQPGREYHFQLEEVNPPARHDYDHLGLDKLGGGLVRDFVLKSGGKKAGAPDDSESLYRMAYYGGRVDLDCRQSEGVLGGGPAGFKPPLRDAYPGQSELEVTLAPQNPLIDGSDGAPVTARLPLSSDGKWTFCLPGVPPGTYTATAHLTPPGGAPMPLRLSRTPARTILKGGPNGYDAVVMDWQPSAVVEFLPNDLGPMPRFGVKAVTLYLGK